MVEVMALEHVKAIDVQILHNSVPQTCLYILENNTKHAFCGASGVCAPIITCAPMRKVHEKKKASRQPARHAAIDIAKLLLYRPVFHFTSSSPDLRTPASL